MQDLTDEQGSIYSNGDASHDVAADNTADTATSPTASRGDLALGYDLGQDTIEDMDMGRSRHDTNGGQGNDAVTSSPPPRLRAIEVVLAPPSDPDSYIRIHRSRTILRILEEMERDDEVFYEVEFKDGRIERAPYDEMIRYKGAQEAIEAYQLRTSLNYTGAAKNQNKRGYSEDEYEESGSDYGFPPKRRKHHVPLTTRHGRGTRQSSRQTSAESGYKDFRGDGFGKSGSRLMDDDDDDDSDDQIRQVATRNQRSVVQIRTNRLTRSRNSTGRTYAATIESDDELAQDHGPHHDDDSVDDFQPVWSDIAPKPRGSKRKKVRAMTRMITKRYESDSSIEFEIARRSGRSTKNLKSMKDPEIDEFDAVEEKQTSAPKHVAIKETFLQLSSTSPFPKWHSKTCESCLAEFGDVKNPLIYCQGCSFSYHKGCIGHRAVREHRVTKIGPEDFVLQCRFCIQGHKKKDARAPDHTMCQGCKISGSSCAEFSSKKTPKQEEKARIDNGGEDPITKVDPLLINNADNLLFRCANCKRGYHFEHLPPLTAEKTDDQDLKESRLEEYSIAGWSCKDCMDTNYKLSALVAWRPLDRTGYRPGQTNQDYNEDEIEYLIKWTGRSHFHDTWMPGAWVFGAAPGTMRQAFYKRDSSTYPKMDNASAIEEEWLLADVLLNVKYRTRVVTSSKAEDLERIEDITSVFVKFQGLSYEEVVWDEPPAPNSGAPWEAFLTAYDEYLNGKYFVTVPDYKMRERITLYRSLDFGKDCELKTQPPQLQKGKLMEYQMEGVNFLLYNFHQQQNVILADEMGLGKTVQIVAFISALTHSKPACWPFLVVVPNATCSNWRRELKQWAPDLRVVTYHGGRVAQDLAYRHELYPDGLKGGMKAHVVIMSYEAAANVKNVFFGVKWVGLIVDEGQRLKNEETTLYKSLREMRIPCRILLTGTPLQNNKRELFNLLQFIDGKRNAEELDAKYAELTKDNLPELHTLIRPYFLRRTKAQVLKFLPPMAQIILPVTMTVVQEKLSKSIMARNPDLIKAIISRSKVKAGERKSMNNILSDLRQCLCHPFCFSSEIEDKTVDMAQMHRNLIEASPKLLLFELMLPKLQERGHRVLIFSQYLHCLTILEDFLTGLDMPYARIDGALSALEKQKRIDAFNAPDSPLFVMLLSTRAGGVGINLATADTVIIYDPDFNPHQDIQALSRAHRIGQKRKVLCFQLMTKNTVEEKIMQMGRKKMALDHALIESMDAKEEAGEDLESILKHGAAALFSDESKDKITYDHASVEKLLDRSQIENTDTGNDDSAETQFSFARIWENDKGDLDLASQTEDAAQDISAEASTSVWENILKEREAEHQRELAASQKVYGRGARRRGTQGIDYMTNRPKGADSDGSEIDVDDELYIDQNDMEDDDSDEYRAAGEAPSVGVGAPSETSGGPGKGRAPKGNHGTTNDIQQQSTQHQKLGLPPTAQSQGILHPQPPRAQSRIVPTQHPVNSNFHNPYVIPNQMPSLTAHMYPPNLTTPSNTHRPVVVQPITAPSGLRMPALRPPAVQLPNGDICSNGLIGGGNPCALCHYSHPTHIPCVDLNSELSLRLALDRLRAVGDSPAIQAARVFFAQQLQNVAARNPTRR
ncbi:putative snf2 family domain-containing protein [Rosellinia necatrix]|uniref:Putative snf2 family domain-containing protein n=1 Tax=Rosellinia necatrix TaxID=77044 RepID=A0A1S7UML9_ROSNE|nr:putative snf2 family domain-containing protein [Rosellinia necatrix]